MEDAMYCNAGLCTSSVPFSENTLIHMGKQMNIKKAMSSLKQKCIFLSYLKSQITLPYPLFYDIIPGMITVLILQYFAT